MQVTQQYARPSTSRTDAKGTHFQLSAEQNRAPVSLHAMVNHSLAYAKLMLTLRKVVVGDWRTPQRDHTKYQEWVQQQYIKELPKYFPSVTEERKNLLLKQDHLQEEIKKLRTQIKPLRKQVNQSRQAYFNYLRTFEKDKWWALDPVISVHPDSVIFEAFSLDESSYGRLSVPTENLEIFGDVSYGTTNIDFSQQLADEVYRVRNYRPAWLNIAYEKVELSTSAGTSVEKKIDLPDTWVRGFLQVQSAATLNGVDLTLSTRTLAEIIAVLQSHRAKVSPRSLRFQLKRGRKPSVIIDPWGTEIEEHEYTYQGEQEGEIKIWGRRRLMIFDEVLPFCDSVKIKLLGTGMPSYWSVDIEGHRFDLGLSGWTTNDWSRQANFDLLASAKRPANLDLTKVEEYLTRCLRTTPKQLAKDMKLSQADATFALQELCRIGQAMYDHLNDSYRRRQLLQQDIKIQETEQDERLRYALQLKKDRKVRLLAQGVENQLNTVEAEVQGKNLFKVKLATDADGRIKKAECSCGFFRRNKLRQGPCQHLLAVVLETHP